MSYPLKIDFEASLFITNIVKRPNSGKKVAPVEFSSLIVSSGLFGLNDLGILNQGEI